MRCNLVILIVAIMIMLSSNRAKAIDQYYSNGTAIDGWTRVSRTTDPDGAYYWTFHFFKKSPGDFWWSQNIAKKYINPADANKRGKIFFYSEPQRVFTGYYDIDRGEYSVLPRNYRRSRLEDIPLSRFPEPGDMPPLYEMGRKNCEPKKSDNRQLEDPPDTPE